MANLVRISMSLEKQLLKQFDRQIEKRGYPTRSEAIKALMRESLISEEWAANEVVAGALTLVYDHHHSGVARKLMGIQHDFVPVIVSTQHVHLDHAHCLEIVVVKGKAAEIRKLEAALKAVKGVKHNSLVTTSIGKNIG